MTANTESLADRSKQTTSEGRPEHGCCCELDCAMRHEEATGSFCNSGTTSLVQRLVYKSLEHRPKSIAWRKGGNRDRVILQTIPLFILSPFHHWRGSDPDAEISDSVWISQTWKMRKSETERIRTFSLLWHIRWILLKNGRPSWAEVTLRSLGRAYLHLSLAFFS